MTKRVVSVMCAAAGLAASCWAHVPDQDSPISATPDAGPSPKLEWPQAESGTLRHAVQLTPPQLFHKAGEAYFSKYARWIIFQAVALPPDGIEPDKHYAMYIAKLTRDEAGKVTGMESPIEISPPGSANTCGFFDPKVPFRVIFGTTRTPYEAENAPGFQRETSTYSWEFPTTMDVCRRVIPALREDFLPGLPQEVKFRYGKDATEAVPVWEAPGYEAECAFHPSGEFIVYTWMNPQTNDADIYLRDLRGRASIPLVTHKGYDGGPFFSADGNSICYRSDRNGDGKLQVFVAELELNADGKPTGLKAEHAVTADEHVNWAPFWHPSGEFLVYTTSAEGHHNYEVYSVEVPLGSNAGKSPAELKRKRITHAPGFDGLPSFSDDGTLMMWTSQRQPNSNEKGSSQVWIAETVDMKP